MAHCVDHLQELGLAVILRITSDVAVAVGHVAVIPVIVFIASDVSLAVGRIEQNPGWTIIEILFLDGNTKWTVMTPVSSTMGRDTI